MSREQTVNTMEYREIFDIRGQMYHQAMMAYPDARKQEFILPLSELALERGFRLIDLPSGGGYIQHYLPDDVILHCLESSEAFAVFCREQQLDVSLFSDAALPLKTHCADGLISIAGLHHISDKLPLFREMHRVLCSGGQVCLADVEQDSAIAGFLDDVVDRYSHTGHTGDFFNGQTAESLAQAGFGHIVARTLYYTWSFPDMAGLLNYFYLLFGLEKASLQDIEAGINQYLQVIRNKDGSVEVEWQLLCLTGTAV